MLNDISHGKGIEYNKNDNVIYDGEIVKGKAEGNGKYIWKMVIIILDNV